MRTDDLIVRLAFEAGPIRPISPLVVRLLGWLTAVGVVIAVVVLVMHPRVDFQNRLGDIAYLATTLNIIGLAVVSAIAALSLSVPNDQRSMLVRVAPTVAAASWMLLLFWQLMIRGSVFGQLLAEPAHVACLFQIAGSAIVPAVVLGRDLRRAAPLEWAWPGTFVVSAALAAGAVGSAITCPIESVAHQAEWHLLPVLLLTLAGPFVGARWLARLR